jgi:hypothetical protein
VQGYAFAAPMGDDEFVTWVAGRTEEKRPALRA